MLRATGGSRHGETDLVEGPENFEPRLADDLRQSVGVGAVAVVAGLHDVGMPAPPTALKSNSRGTDRQKRSIRSRG